MGYMLETQKVHLYNTSGAFYWFQKAAEWGDAEGQKWFGTLYEKGKVSAFVKIRLIRVPFSETAFERIDFESIRSRKFRNSVGKVE
jgi:TPR repeat protein